MSIKRLSVGFAILFGCIGAQAAPVSIDAVRIAAQDVQTRVALDLSASVEHKVFSLPPAAGKPPRVVIDIKGARIAPKVLPFPSGRGAVHRIRGANRPDGTVRIVLDLKHAAQPRSFALAPMADRGNRLVVDLEPDQTQAPASPPRVSPSAAPARSEPTGQRDLVIAVDAGHGGKDPGARGPQGTREKDVVMQIARRLAAEIDAEPGMRAFMTRKGDEFITLRNRMERSRAAAADLFISIHADAFSDRRVRGTTVYVLSDKGATDEASRRLAERENAADLIGGVSLTDKDPTLASVLLDLSQNASLSSSIDVGDEILAELSAFASLRKRQVQQAPFLVLKSPDVPSVLIETAFISNPQDERNLNSPGYQRRLAAAILAGVRDYFYINPPPGTRVAQLAKAGVPAPREYVIRRGDTLSEIATRYNVSLRNIRAVNKLRNDRIVVGQVLRIPGPTDT